MGQVVIGVDPHKRSATIEVIDQRERVLGKVRFGTDRAGYQALLTAGRKHTERIGAVEGRNGIGRHVATIAEQSVAGRDSFSLSRVTPTAQAFPPARQDRHGTVEVPASMATFRQPWTARNSEADPRSTCTHTA